ncbi:hypothetical protein HZB88_00535 [archaeon]|nr:hypothetical protein [archaeon]
MKLLSFAILLLLTPFVSAFAVSPPILELGTISQETSGQLKVYNNLDKEQVYSITSDSPSITFPSHITVRPNEWETFDIAVIPEENGRFNKRLFITEQTGDFENRVAVKLDYNAVNITQDLKIGQLSSLQGNLQIKTEETGSTKQSGNADAEKTAFFGLSALVLGLFALKLRKRSLRRKNA